MMTVSKRTTTTPRVRMRRLSRGFAVAGAGILVAGLVTAPSDRDLLEVRTVQHRSVSLAALTLPSPIPAGAITGMWRITPRPTGEQTIKVVDDSDLATSAALDEPDDPSQSATLALSPTSLGSLPPLTQARIQEFFFAAALVGGIVVDHGIHATACHAKKQPRLAQFLEVTQVVPPIRLRHDGYAKALRLDDATDHGRPECGVIHVGVTGNQNHIIRNHG